MAFNINQFKSELVGGGARPTLFEVTLTLPAAIRAANATGESKSRFMIRAAALPESTLGSIQIPYFGRVVKMGGDRIFGDWTVTVINDEDFSVRNAMESWTNLINTHITNARAYPQTYKTQAQIVQYAKTGVPIREYTFEGLYPVTVDQIGMNWGETDVIEEFTVTFQYDLWRVSAGTTGTSTT